MTLVTAAQGKDFVVAGTDSRGTFGHSEVTYSAYDTMQKLVALTPHVTELTYGAGEIGDNIFYLKIYDELKVNALTLERVLNDAYGVKLPHNRIHMILKEAGRALPQPSKQTRRKWVRYEREHSMSVWHMDWKQLSDGRWWVAAEDDASRLIVGYGVFQEATAEHTIHILKHAITKYGRPREVLTDRGSQFYADESERREKGISQFEAFLAEQGIKHFLCRVNHP
jgi:putative transposase